MDAKPEADALAISVIAPCFNEEFNIPALTERVIATLDRGGIAGELVLVDDGIATGTTMRAALQALRRRGVAHTVLAVPVAPHETLKRLAGLADRVVCLAEPPGFRSVGEHYAEFPQVGDDEVVAALRAALRGPPASARDIARRFQGAPRRADQLEAMLQTLVALGQARHLEDGRYTA